MSETQEENPATIYLDELAERAYNTAVEKGWWDEGTPRSPAIQTLNATGEVIEAFNSLQVPDLDKVCDKCAGTPGQRRPYNVQQQDSPPPCPKCKGTAKAIAGGRYVEECADVFIRVLDTAYRYGFEATCDNVPAQEITTTTPTTEERAEALYLIMYRLGHLHTWVRMAQRVEEGHEPVMPQDNFDDLTRTGVRALCTGIVKASGVPLTDFLCAVVEKMAYNETRPTRHGKRF